LVLKLKNCIKKKPKTTMIPAAMANWITNVLLVKNLIVLIKGILAKI
jgi:hypothetical protein